MIQFDPVRYFDEINYIQLSEKSYRVVLYNVSKEVYNYIVSTSKSVLSNNNPLSEPVAVFTNIIGGLGVFGGISSSSVFIKN